jgi:alcohol dehydrogenase (cytochrome c)
MRKHLVLLFLVVAGVCAGAEHAGVTYERLLKTAQEPHNWLTYSGNYAGWRYSPLSQINAGNVEHLAVQWVFQTGTAGSFQATPLVVDGIMYLTGSRNVAWALDARTGRVLWRYQRPLPEKIPLCCGPQNRGFAVLGNKLFLATLDAHVVALDAKTGNLLWDVPAEDHRKGYSFTLAPLLVKNKIIVGVAGGEYGVRGFIDAYDTETGQRAWRFYTIPGPGEPGHESWQGDSWKRGGASAWVTGTYDPELNLVYWGIGNPGPDLYGGERKGDNLYSDSVVALDADTGKLKWHFQFTPHDLHDWDATQIPVLLDAEIEGRPRKLLVLANRNGFFYVLDRSNGTFLRAKAFAKVTWAKEIGRDGRPVVLPGTDPTPEGNYVCPSLGGAANWYSPSYHPGTGLLYVNTRERCENFFSAPQPYREGHVYFGSATHTKSDERGWGALRALDPRSGDMKWEFKYYSVPASGTLATAGGLVFAADGDGNLVACDAKTGKLLWHLQTGSSVTAAPMAYAVDGKQYIAAPSGGVLFTFGLPAAMMEKQISQK